MRDVDRAYAKALTKAIYIDVNTLVGRNGLPELVPDILAINNSLYNIITCPVGSRIMQREYGSRLNEFIHQPCDNITAFEIEISLVQSIERWEPRITIVRSETSVVPLPSRDGFAVKLAYFVPRLSLDGTLSLTAKRQN